MQYNVRALSSDNLICWLTVDAPDEADAPRQLAARGLCAAAVAPAGRFSTGAKDGGSGRRRLSHPAA